jgi:RNA polymerase-binding transcription factor DksA
MTSVRERLEGALREAEREIQELDERLDNKPKFGFGEGSAETYSWEMTLARRERVSARIEALREALVRVRTGIYGRCRRCGVQIDPERLDVLPATSLCVACARAVSAATTPAPGVQV